MVLINNRYSIVRTLGKGGMGIVYLVEDTLRDNMKYALKTINKTNLIQTHKVGIDTFKKEYEIMTRLKHPNLIQVHDFGISDDNCFIVMDYLQGSLLRELIQSNEQFLMDKYLDIVVQTARALDFIHSRDIIYRDIKPANIILSDEKPILLDFGLSDIGDADRDADTIKGTILYLAPEVLLGDINYSIDFFSLGILFFELLTKRPYYINMNGNAPAVQKLIEIMKNKELYISHQDAQLQNIENKSIIPILKKMLSFEKDNRYKTGYELIRDINMCFYTSFDFETIQTKQSYVLGCGFADREKEFNELKEKIFANKKASLFVYSGSVGVGKTRLFNELKKFCRINNILFFDANCSEGSIFEYYSIGELLGQMIAYSESELLDRYSAHLKLILPGHKDLNELADLNISEPKVLKAIIDEKISDFIIDFLKYYQSKIILYFNDLQWIEDGSAEIVISVLNKLENHDVKTSPIIFFANVNDDIMDEKSPAGNLLSRQATEVYSLAPLKADGIRDFIEKAFGRRFIDKTLIESVPGINNMVGGNPLFLEELIRHLLERNYIVKEGGLWKIARDFLEIDLPSNIMEIANTRICKILLDNSKKRTMQILSILRIDLAFDALKSVLSRLITADVKSILIELERQEIIKSFTSGSILKYSIASSLLKELVKKTISDTKELHQVLAESMESLSPIYQDYFIEEIAYHYMESGNEQKAIQYYVKSGDISQKMYFNNKAIIAYDIVLDHLPEDDPEGRLQVLYKKAFSLEALSRWDEALLILDQCISITGSLSLTKLAVKAYNLYGLICIKQGKAAKAKESFDRAFNSINNAFSPEYAETLYNIGTYFYDQAKYSEALIYYEQYRDLCHEMDDRKGYTKSLNDIGNLYYFQSNYQKALEFYEEYRKNSQEIGDTRDYGIALGNIGNVYYITGEYENALKYYKTYSLISLEIGDKREYKIAVNNIGNVHYVLGKPDKALDYYEISRNISKEIGDKRGYANAVGNIGNIYASEEKYDEALECFHLLSDTSKEIGYRTGYAFAVGSIGSIFYDKGDFDKALAYFEEAMNIYQEINDKMRFGFAVSNMGYVYYDQGLFQKALECFLIHSNISDEIGDKRGHGIAESNIGRLYYIMQNYQKALEYIDLSIRIFSDLKIYQSLCRCINIKTDLMIELNNLSEADLLNKKVLQIASETGNSEILIRAKILSAKLISDPQQAADSLKSLLAETDNPDHLAEIYYELCRITDNADHRDMTIKLYKDLYKQIPKIEYKIKLEKLGIEL